MDKLSSKFANLQGMPSGLARRVVTESYAKANKGKARANVHLEDAGTEFASRLAGGRTPAPIIPEKGSDREPSAKVAGRSPQGSRKAKAKKALAEAVKRSRAKKPEKYKAAHRAYMKDWRARQKPKGGDMK